MKNHAYLKIARKAFVLSLNLILLLVVVSCGSSFQTKESKETELKKISRIMEGGTFSIENEWAYPFSGSRIDLIGNPNFFKIDGDSADVNLPYFGVRQFGGFGDRGGIIFNEPITDVIIEQGKNAKSMVMKFNAKQGTENLQFYVTIFPNNRTDISVNSSQRDIISYQGHIRSTQKDE